MEWYTAANRFTEALAAPEPTPGGGAAAAQTGAMGCALLLMAIGTTLKKKTIEPNIKNSLETSAKRIGSLKNQLKQFVQQDAEAYTGYLTAKRIPKEDPSRDVALQTALATAARVPADTAATALQVLKELEGIKSQIAPIILADVACAKHLLKASIRCAVENIRANIPFIQNQELAEKLDKQIQLFLKSCEGENYD